MHGLAFITNSWWSLFKDPSKNLSIKWWNWIKIATYRKQLTFAFPSEAFCNVSNYCFRGIFRQFSSSHSLWSNRHNSPPCFMIDMQNFCDELTYRGWLKMGESPNCSVIDLNHITSSWRVVRQFNATGFLLLSSWSIAFSMETDKKSQSYLVHSSVPWRATSDFDTANNHRDATVYNEWLACWVRKNVALANS